MRKWLSVMLSSVLALSLVVGCVFPAVADTDVAQPTPWILMDEGVGYTGDVCTTMSIRIFDNPGISYLKLKVSYPSAYYYGGESVDVITQCQVLEQDFPGLVIVPVDEGPDQTSFYIIWESADGQDVTTDGVLADLVFSAAAENEAIDVVPVRLYCQTGDAVNAAGDRVPFKTANGYLTLSLYRVGDANCDGKINNRDLGMLQQYLNGADVWVSMETADLNGDGQINNRDLGLMQRHLNNLDVDLYDPLKHFDGTVSPPQE